MDWTASEFDWDPGNESKNWERHRVTQVEAEQVFFNLPLVVTEDELHSDREIRHFALGQTDRGRRLFIAFTLRDDRVRVISARDMTRRERKVYEHAHE